jgi:hypothetical protein
MIFGRYISLVFNNFCWVSNDISFKNVEGVNYNKIIQRILCLQIGC